MDRFVISTELFPTSTFQKRQHYGKGWTGSEMTRSHLGRQVAEGPSKPGLSPRFDIPALATPNTLPKLRHSQHLNTIIVSVIC